MKTKLTLRIDEALIRRAKEKAKGRGTSVSQMVADYFSLLQNPEGSSEARKKGHSSADESSSGSKDASSENAVPPGYEFSEFTKASAGVFGEWDRDIAPEEAHRQHRMRKHA